MKKDNILKLINKDGIETTYEIICVFHLESTDKNYIVFTDNTKNKKNELNVYAAIFDPDDDTVFESVNTEEEYSEIEKVLEKINKKGNKND